VAIYLGLGVVLAMVVGYWAIEQMLYFPSTTYVSPSGRCELVVLARWRLFAMPGQGRDGPGRVELREVGAWWRLGAAELPIMSLFEEPVWESGRVSVGKVLEIEAPPICGYPVG
jgi:hypothetical protein